MRKNSIKNNRINGEVMRVIAEAVRSSKDPRIPVMTSVTDVIVAPDLKTCKVYVSVMGSEEEQQKAMEGLKNANGYLRSAIAKTLNMRRTPELTFFADHSAQYAIDISRRIDEVVARDKASQAMRGETEEAEEEEETNE